MSNQRTSIFDDDEELDVSDFITGKPPERAEASRNDVRRIAEAANFKSREPTPQQSYRRFRTGRNVQLNIKVRQETLDAFNRICDTYGWVQGEALEHAIAALEEGLASNPPPLPRR